MSESELYQIARERIDARNRRWTWWAVDLLVLILTLAAVALTEGSPLFAAIFLGWGGVFTVHTILVSLAQSRTSSIEREVDRLRAAAANEGVYEKPKRQARVELSEDGELIPADDDDFEDETPDAQRSRNS